MCRDRRQQSNSKRFPSAVGFSLVELCIVVLISVVAAAMAIPGFTSINRYLRITGDIRDINGLVAQAKMRAAQDYTHARVHANLASNTFELEVWDNTAGCWKTDGDTVNQCTMSASPVQYLSQGVSFGFGGVTAASPNPQSAIAQAPVCTNGVAGPAPGSSIADTACIEFNSRGLPVGSSGSPTANDALYVTDSNTVDGITVIVSGLIQVWTSPASGTTWAAR